MAEALPHLLRKIVRLLVGTISFPALVEMLRSIYVEEGIRQLEQEGSRPTKSALALITGLDTRVVPAVLKRNDDPSVEPQHVSPEYALIDMWNSDPFFQDPKSGDPAILPIEGKGRTFQGLVLRAIGRNVTVKTVLDRLQASSTINIIDGDTQQVELLSFEFTPIGSDDAKLTDITILEASRVMSAGIHNMVSPPETRVPQQGRWTYRLAPERYREFRREARDLLHKQIKEGEALLERFEEPKKQPGQLTVGIGWYQWGDHDSDVTETNDVTGD
ncbi:MAG: DUF6502 family protein [Pseudomonadota bacterium]